MVPRQDSWAGLFGPETSPQQAFRVPMRVLRRHDRPFLLLPGQPRAAAATLALYPAQTMRARAARATLRWLLAGSLPSGIERVSLAISPNDPFAVFLSSLASQPPGGLPTLGVLAGNPASDSQRFIVLVFDADQRPLAVVKAGLSPTARRLIKQEAAFLAAVAQNPLGIPRLRSTFESPRLSALALDFFPGDSPRQRDEGAIPALLGSWVDATRKLTVSAAPDWARLEKAVQSQDRFAPVAAQLRTLAFHPVVGHGDFAPWNIKVSPEGVWTVLDWERGELTGLPAWDWFHYVIQTGILVKRLPISCLVERAEDMLNSAPFKQYARRTAIAGRERHLTLAYLFHCVEVLKPAEGLRQAQELLTALIERWP